MSAPRALKATEVSETLLEQTGKAMLSGDFASFAQCFHLPHTIETPDSKTTLKTRDALSTLFFKVLQDYRDRNVTTLIRYCEVAEFRGPLKVEATHSSHVMAGDQRVMEPFFGFSVIEFIEDRWQLTSTQYTADKETNLARALHAMIDQGTVAVPMAPDISTLKKET